MKEFKTLITERERDDVYSKMKNTFDFLASVVDDEKSSYVHRIRAAKSLSAIAKTLRVYIQDEERYYELEKKIKKLKKKMGIKE